MSARVEFVCEAGGRNGRQWLVHASAASQDQTPTPFFWQMLLRCKVKAAAGHLRRRGASAWYLIRFRLKNVYIKVLYRTQ